MAIKSSRRGRIPPFIVMDVMAAANARAAEGFDIVHLEVGQPSTPAPAGVIAAARAALDADRIGYTEAFGLPALRRAIVGRYRDQYGIDLPERRIAVTTGSSGAFILSFLAAFDAGDRVAFAAPGYPGYRNILAALDIETVSLPARREDGFQPTVDLLEALDRPPDGLIVASPANPTGSMLDEAALRRLCDWCRMSGVRVISDEIYHGITYGKDAVTMAALDPAAIVINSFSKYYSMTGWRLGWMVVPEDLLRAVECLAQNLFISPPTLSQFAALGVFDCVPELEANVARYRENRAILLEGLPRCGFGPFAAADGAFYIYAGIEAFGADSVTLAREILETAGVAATPGIDFDAEAGSRFMRFSYAGSAEEMREAVRRLVSWSQGRKTQPAPRINLP
jgi:aspartate/methionine/tyrosine aminotransferase